MKYRLKSNVIEAVQWRGDNLDELISFYEKIEGKPDRKSLAQYVENVLVKGDYLVGLVGSISVIHQIMSPECFKKLFEPIKESAGEEAL